MTARTVCFVAKARLEDRQEVEITGHVEITTTGRVIKEEIDSTARKFMTDLALKKYGWHVSEIIAWSLVEFS